jgi:hypothetical protein
MKTITILILVTCSAAAFAGYDYTITDGYFGSKTVKGHESLLMTGGGGAILTTEDYSIVDIQNTAPLQELTGGIWNVDLTDWSRLNMAGGGIKWLGMGNESTAVLSGGRIDNIESWQTVSVIGRDPVTQEFIFNRHIEMFVKNYTYNTLTKILKGTWGDDSLFRIQLIDRTQYGYSPAIENIQFTIVPEPVSLLLLALGGMMIRRRS